MPGTGTTNDLVAETYTINGCAASLLVGLGFTSDLPTPPATPTYGSPDSGFPGGQNPWSLLQIKPTPTQADVYYIIPLEDNSPEGNSLYIPGYIDEDAFIKPLLHMITDPKFFANGTTGGVVFSTDVELKHGKVSWQLAIINLVIPLMWTFILAVVANGRKRWTASLDAFAMFKLGGDWRGNLKDLRLADMSESKNTLESILGEVHVDPDAGIAELAHPVQGHVESTSTGDSIYEPKTTSTTTEVDVDA